VKVKDIRKYFIKKLDKNNINIKKSTISMTGSKSEQEKKQAGEEAAEKAQKI